MGLKESRIYTIEDIYSLPEGTRAELIDGELYMMAPPKRIHQQITMRLSAAIYNHIKSKSGPCDVYPAPFAVFLTADDKTYVEPDISVICNPEKLTEQGCNGAPDWIIEIVSSSSRKMDYSTKNTLYSNAGVREYWIIDPEKERVTIYRYEEDAAPSIASFDQHIVSGIYPDLEINIVELLK